MPISLNGESICAICTSPGIGSISVIRLSGKDSKTIVEKIFSKKLIKQRFMYYGSFKFKNKKKKLAQIEKILGEKIKKKQNPEEVKPQIRQASEFEKKEIIDTNQIAALIDKAKEIEAVKTVSVEQVRQQEHSIKDEILTLLISAIFIFTFLPFLE